MGNHNSGEVLDERLRSRRSTPAQSVWSTLLERNRGTTVTLAPPNLRCRSHGGYPKSVHRGSRAVEALLALALSSSAIIAVAVGRRNARLDEHPRGP
jgi:hypothetical protein